jgi:hypothetical protein
MPVAQTFVLRRVLTGGISTDRRLAAAAGSKYGCPFSSEAGVLERGPVGGCQVVFGTLLGPEATGPWRGRAPLCCGVAVAVWDLCFWFPGCTDRARSGSFAGAGVRGVWYGVVV